MQNFKAVSDVMEMIKDIPNKKNIEDIKEHYDEEKWRNILP